ncbi:Hypothetical_protein [Hexamita inflata]|uniref:Hypothetical_protein n=1 Tax=Hexamita inflata TaxID=28002 RepID=A0AA86Q1Y0_9EUKA|nr:Hypothetical protein HINF_LOCUS32815 [Hexamita inflata]
MLHLPAKHDSERGPRRLRGHNWMRAWLLERRGHLLRLFLRERLFDRRPLQPVRLLRFERPSHPVLVRSVRMRSGRFQGHFVRVLRLQPKLLSRVRRVLLFQETFFGRPDLFRQVPGRGGLHQRNCPVLYLRIQGLQRGPNRLCRQNRVFSILQSRAPTHCVSDCAQRQSRYRSTAQQKST